MTQRGLADVRAPDDRDAERSSLLVGASAEPRAGELVDEPVEQVAGAEPVGRGDRQRLAEAERVELGAEGSSLGRSTLLATTTTGSPRGAGSRRPRRRPGAGRRARRARAATASASAIAARACAWTARESSSLGLEVDAAGVDQSKPTPFHSHSSALRSRVTPASAWTTASRPPARRLTSVDLPTLGKPTTAIRGQPRGAHRRPEPPLAGELDDPLDDLVDGEARGVELDRVVGGAQRSVLALAVARGRARACAASTVARRLAGLARSGAGARSSSLAVRKTLSGESGLTTVPMSRPSAT